jgi:hypothetical protein
LLNLQLYSSQLWSCDRYASQNCILMMWVSPLQRIIIYHYSFQMFYFEIQHIDPKKWRDKMKLLTKINEYRHPHEKDSLYSILSLWKCASSIHTLHSGSTECTMVNSPQSRKPKYAITHVASKSISVYGVKYVRLNRWHISRSKPKVIGSLGLVGCDSFFLIPLYRASR